MIKHNLNGKADSVLKTVQKINNEGKMNDETKKYLNQPLDATHKFN